MPLKPPTMQSTPYHILSIQGREGSGKSHLAAKAPKKQTIASTEAGWQRVIKKFDNWETNFLIGEYPMIADLSADILFKAGERTESEAAAEKQAEKIRKTLWEPFTKDMAGAFTDPSIKSVVYDLADEFREIVRLAHLGKLERNPQMAYGPVNAEWKNMYRLALRHKKTLISIHTVKQAYRTAIDERSGKEKSVEIPGLFNRRPDANIDYAIESFIACRGVMKGQKSPGGHTATEQEFWIEILNAKKNPLANGTVIPQPETWAELMMYLDPDTSPEAWEAL